MIDAVQRDGTCWMGGTVWQERHAMRISVSDSATTEHDIDISADAVVRAWQLDLRLSAEASGLDDREHRLERVEVTEHCVERAGVAIALDSAGDERRGDISRVRAQFE